MENRITLKEFLESIPPYREMEISDLNIFDGNLALGIPGVPWVSSTTPSMWIPQTSPAGSCCGTKSMPVRS